MEEHWRKLQRTRCDAGWCDLRVPTLKSPQQLIADANIAAAKGSQAKRAAAAPETSKHGPRVASWLIATWLLVSTAAVFLNSIYAGIIERARAGRLNIPNSTVPASPGHDFNQLDLLAPSLLAVSVFLLHFAYLFIVAWEQIYKRHASKRELPNIVLIVLLGLAYIVPTGFYIAGIPQGTIKLVSVGFFALLYLSWCGIDWYELRRDTPGWFHERWRALRRRLKHPFKSPAVVQAGVANPQTGPQHNPSVDPHGGGHEHQSGDGSHAHGELTTAEQVQKSVWMYIDLVLGTVLLLSVAGYLLSKVEWLGKHVARLDDLLKFSWAEAFTVKEVAVAVTIIAWFVVQLVIKNSSKGSEVLSHKLWQDTIEHHHSRDSNPIKLPAEIQARCTAKGEINVVVANCGTGKRTQQLLRLLRLGDQALYDQRKRWVYEEDQKKRVATDESYGSDGVLAKVRLWGYNHDKAVEGFGEHVDHDHFTSDTKTAQSWASAADIIIVLHSTYDSFETKRIEAVLEKANKEGCLILVRGFADHSYLATICYHLIDRGFSETPRYHVWNSEHLNGLSERLKFSQLHLTDPKQPVREFRLKHPNVTGVNSQPDRAPMIQACLIVHQHFKVSPFTNACIEDYLSRQFDPVRAELVAHQLESILRTTDHDPRLNNGLNGDDFVYAFWYGKPPEGMPITTTGGTGLHLVDGTAEANPGDAPPATTGTPAATTTLPATGAPRETGAPVAADLPAATGASASTATPPTTLTPPADPVHPPNQEHVP